MPNIAAEANVICPYYRSMASTSIRCEAYSKNAIRCDLIFASTEERDKFQSSVCCNWRYGERCDRAFMLDKKYHVKSHTRKDEST